MLTGNSQVFASCSPVHTRTICLKLVIYSDVYRSGVIFFHYGKDVVRVQVLVVQQVVGFFAVVHRFNSFSQQLHLGVELFVKSLYSLLTVFFLLFLLLGCQLLGNFFENFRLNFMNFFVLLYLLLPLGRDLLSELFGLKGSSFVSLFPLCGLPFSLLSGNFKILVVYCSDLHC